MISPECKQYFDQPLQDQYKKLDKYTPRHWRMYNEGKDIGYNNGYNQGLTEGHDDGWDEDKEYYQRIFERERREAKESWQRIFDKVGSLPFEEIEDEVQNELPPGEWSDYQKDSDW